MNPVDLMPAANLKPGRSSDTQWLFELFRATNRDYIDSTWGWDELLQREAFFTNLPGTQFRILEFNGKSVGGYHLANKQDHLWLEMILVDPACQRQGLGTLMMNELKERARAVGLPVRLSVLRANPALHFYTAQGFETVTEDQFSLKMQWQSQGASD